MSPIFFFLNKLLLQAWSPMSELFLQLCRHLLAHWQQGCRPGRVDALRPKSSHHLHSLMPCSVHRDVGITFRPSPQQPQSTSTCAHSKDMHTAPRTSHVHTHTSVCPRDTPEMLCPSSLPTLSLHFHVENQEKPHLPGH